MNIGVYFWLSGLVLIWLEFYLPGGILGACALVLLLSAPISWALLGWTTSQLLWALGAMGISIALVSALALKTLKRGAAIEAKSEQGHFAAEFRAELIGREALAVGDLSPSGYIEINAQRHPAISQMGHIKAGAKVVIRGGEGFSLLVAPSSHSQP